VIEGLFHAQCVYSAATGRRWLPAIAATAGETSSDETLVERIADGNKVGMQRVRKTGRTASRGPVRSHSALTMPHVGLFDYGGKIQTEALPTPDRDRRKRAS
jgi:hypothetical protein